MRVPAGGVESGMQQWPSMSSCSSFGIPFMSSNNIFLPADSWWTRVPAGGCESGLQQWPFMSSCSSFHELQQLFFTCWWLVYSGPRRRMRVWAEAMAFYELLFQLSWAPTTFIYLLIAGEFGSQQADESLGCGNGLLWALVPALVFLSWAPVTYFYLLIAGELGSQEADESLGCGNGLLWALVPPLVFLSRAPATYLYRTDSWWIRVPGGGWESGCGNGLLRALVPALVFLSWAPMTYFTCW